jgi:hypothetical protein
MDALGATGVGQPTESATRRLDAVLHASAEVFPGVGDGDDCRLRGTGVSRGSAARGRGRRAPDGLPGLRPPGTARNVYDDGEVGALPPGPKSGLASIDAARQRATGRFPVGWRMASGGGVNV